MDPTILIIIQGGIISAILSDQPIRYIVVDYDCPDGPPEDAGDNARPADIYDGVADTEERPYIEAILELV